MADQTAVALQNARLVDDIVHVNAALKKAYNDLETANRELQELDRLKSNFIGMITHELRTPFAKIAFSLQLLQRYGTDHWAPEQQEQLQQLNSNLQEARVMVDNLINFSAFLSKQGKLNLAEVNFATVIQEAARVVRPMADRRNLELLLKVPDQLPVIYGDRDRLVEAAQHLIHNAVKFTDKGKITVSCWATEKNITLEVKDTGVGIPKDKLASIWKGFSQMADAVKRGVEGLGLGLALVKYVVSAHGGEVWVHSMEKYGSTFGFYIPVMPKTDDFLRPH
jgi:signal transduction histidine kinase